MCHALDDAKRKMKMMSSCSLFVSFLPLVVFVLCCRLFLFVSCLLFLRSDFWFYFSIVSFSSWSFTFSLACSWSWLRSVVAFCSLVFLFAFLVLLVRCSRPLFVVAVSVSFFDLFSACLCHCVLFLPSLSLSLALSVCCLVFACICARHKFVVCPWEARRSEWRQPCQPVWSIRKIKTFKFSF